MRVADVMTPTVVVAQGWQTVDEARALMQLHHVAHLPVFVGGEPRGVLRASDLVCAGLEAGEPRSRAERTCVDDLLVGDRRRRLLIVSPRTSVDEARALLADGSVDCLVVGTPGGRIAGIVTSTDLREVDGAWRDPAYGADGDHERFAPRVPVQLVAQEFVSAEALTVELRSLSATGALLRGPDRPPPPHEVVSLTWLLPGRGEAIWAAGRVRRYAPAPAVGGTLAHAVEFVAVPEADRAHIRRFVAERLARTSGRRDVSG